MTERLELTIVGSGRDNCIAQADRMATEWFGGSPYIARRIHRVHPETFITADGMTVTVDRWMMEVDYVCDQAKDHDYTWIADPGVGSR